MALSITNYRSQLQAILGKRGYATAELDAWINMGYQDLAGVVDFPELEETSTVNTAGNTQSISAPPNVLVIQLLKDETSDVALQWLAKPELFRRKISPEGAPKYWTRQGDLIYLSPVPDGVYAIRVFFKQAPADLGTGSSSSVFPDVWDPVILQLAAHYALMGTGQEQRGAAFLSRAVTYIQSHITEDDLRGHEIGLDASIANLTNRLETLRGGS